MGLIGLPILLRILPFSIYVTQALFTAAVVVLSYLSHKYFSFRGGRKRSALLGKEGQVAETRAAEVPSREGTVL
jgi:membrane protein implicated in regulation of membrane protease activity